MVCFLSPCLCIGFNENLAVFLYWPEDSEGVRKECISQTSQSEGWFFSLYNVIAVIASSFPGVLHILDAVLLSWIHPLFTILKKVFFIREAYLFVSPISLNCLDYTYSKLFPLLHHPLLKLLACFCFCVSVPWTEFPLETLPTVLLVAIGFRNPGHVLPYPAAQFCS